MRLKSCRRETKKPSNNVGRKGKQNYVCVVYVCVWGGGGREGKRTAKIKHLSQEGVKPGILKGRSLEVSSH